jgi:hypothetical protein
MARHTARLRPSDVERLINAVRRAGLAIFRIEAEPGGRVAIVTSAEQVLDQSGEPNPDSPRDESPDAIMRAIDAV